MDEEEILEMLKTQLSLAIKTNNYSCGPTLSTNVHVIQLILDDEVISEIMLPRDNFERKN